MPPFPPSVREVRLEDVDRGVKAWFKRVVQAQVDDPGGGKRDVHVTFSSGERWVAAADKQGIRDKDGRLILPVIEISRNGFDMSDNMTALGVNQPTMQIARRISPKTNRLKNLDQSRPISERRLRDGAVYEIYTIPFPINGTMPYRVRIQAQYTQQMNAIVEKLLFNLEFFDVPSFLIELDADHRPAGIPDGRGRSELLPSDHQKFDQRKPPDGYYVVGYLQGNLNDEGNLREFTDQERIIELSFEFKVPVALMVDPSGERPAVQRELTAFHIEMGVEECHHVDSIDELDIIFGPDGVK